MDRTSQQGLGGGGDFAQEIGRHIRAVVPDDGIDVLIEPGGAKETDLLQWVKDRPLEVVFQIDPALGSILKTET